MGDDLWGWCCWGINEIHLWMIPCGEFQPWCCWVFSTFFYVGLWCALRWRSTLFEIWEMTMKNFFLLLPPFLSSCFFVCFIPLHDAVVRLHGNGVVESGTVARWTRPCWASISFQWEMVWDGACNNVYRISDLGTEFFPCFSDHFT